MDKQKIAKLIMAYTGGNSHNLYYRLCGNAKGSVRAHIMSEIAGHKMPQSKSSITAILARLMEIFEIEGSCPAVREDMIGAAIKSAA